MRVDLEQIGVQPEQRASEGAPGRLIACPGCGVCSFMTSTSSWTVDLLRSRGKLDFGRLAISLARMRQRQQFVLTAWIFLPDRWRGGLTIDRVRLPADEKPRIETESSGPTREVPLASFTQEWNTGNFDSRRIH